MLSSAPMGEITQGTIFSCARSEAYPRAECYGIVITAQCDIEQDKFPVLNYLPIIPLKDWLCRDGIALLKERILADKYGSYKNAAQESGIPESVIELFSPESVLNDYFDPNIAKKGAQDRIANAVATLKFIEECSNDHAGLKKISEKFSKNISILIKDLL